ncbi:hypothetical protein E2C01_084676 [Portunus trituberculatus]|uniref:Uncharacterized protein n=1 Tax=Portunus trituberculatus TaxID=210409 RepID=A0A5B7J8D1_PORTR|nr:hypothetical protein [Portunus trituberculatus]
MKKRISSVDSNNDNALVVLEFRLVESSVMKMVTRIAASALVVVMVVAMIGPAAATPSPKAEAAAAAAAAAEPCCGRGAAGALGFVGGFVIGRAVGHRHHHHHHGCGGCGGGWCGGCGRRRRSLDEVMGTGKLEEVYRLVISWFK